MWLIVTGISCCVFTFRSFTSGAIVVPCQTCSSQYCKSSGKRRISTRRNAKPLTLSTTTANASKAKYLTYISETSPNCRTCMRISLLEHRSKKQRNCMQHHQSAMKQRGSVVRQTFPDLRLIHGWHVTNSWVKCPLWVNHQGQLSLSSFRGR